MTELQGGSSQAFERLAGDLFKPLWHFLVNKRGVPKLDAEELASDVLMKVHANVGTFRKSSRAQLTTWIFEITKNTATDFYRASLVETEARTNNEPTSREECQEWIEKAQLNRSVGSLAERNVSYRDWLRDELEKHPADDQLILLWRTQDVTFAQIGEWLGIKEGTACVRHHRAKRKLESAAQKWEMLGVAPGQDFQESGAWHE